MPALGASVGTSVEGNWVVLWWSAILRITLRIECRSGFLVLRLSEAVNGAEICSPEFCKRGS